MPRLLLVDDNPSIHNIATTLLASTDIQLTCVDSAAKALALVDAGERFDVALIDTHMGVMDGWTLLERLRDRPETASMPIAMMAGVLDNVDPIKVESASIQGFLKKPVELRDLGERVRALIAMEVATPVEARQEPSPFATMPATRISDLPEYRPSQDDVLILTEEDVLPEKEFIPVAGQATYEVPVEMLDTEEALDLEALDLESLKDLQPNAQASAIAEQGTAELPDLSSHLADAPALAAMEVEHEEPSLDLPDLGSDVSQDAPELEEPVLQRDIFPGNAVSVDIPAPAPAFEEAPSAIWHTEEAEPSLEALLPPEPTLPAEEDFSLDIEERLDFSSVAQAMPVEPASVIAEDPILQDHIPAPPAEEPAAETIAIPVEPAPLPAAGTVASHELVAAILADQAAMNLLVKALAERLGDKVLREVAWEVMPEIAERLNRP